MANPVSSVDVPLSLFSGLNTELSPPDQPEGASPANNDVAFTPGAVSTRPGVNHIFSVPVSSLGPFTYEKSYVQPSGDIKNLYLTKGDGILWVEDVTNTPGVATVLFQTAGATYASSCTASGREYIALSDGQVGVDYPIQYDGTNLWRVTNDGPGAPPVVSSIALPTVSMATTGSGSALAITSIGTTGLVSPKPGIIYYTMFTVLLTGSAPPVNAEVVIAGNTQPDFNGTWFVRSSSGNQFTVTFYSTVNLAGTGGTATPTGGITLQRQGNTVTGTTAAAHQLLKGYQVQIQGAGTTVIGGTITSIVLNNEDTPGLATVTTSVPHGLLPNNQVNIQGVNGVTVGTAITNVAFAGDFITITTSTPHGLSIGSEVIIDCGTTVSANGQWVVAAVPTTTTFTYAFVSAVTAFTVADTGTVTYLWPLASVNPAQNFFTVQTAPTLTTFTITLNYTDGTWSGGTVSFQWDGIFFVTAVPSSLTFQYQQYGPNATTSTVGTVTPYGQATPGIHQLQQCFLFASGAISSPSPQTTFVANGGQYLSITQLATGPSYVIARILIFTGAGGAYFFYIPVPAQVNGLTVSTATQINDNTTTSIILDFSDNTLYSATAVSIPGNNLAAQVILAPCAGFFTYASRLMGWGERNNVKNFLNMAFGGGFAIGSPNSPLAWTTSDAQGVLLPSRLGMAWRMNIGTINAAQGEIKQNAYLDGSGGQILLGNTFYSPRLWAKSSVSDPNLVLHIGIISGSFMTSIVLGSIQTGGGYIEGNFANPTPASIPIDAQIFLYAQGVSIGEWIEVSEIEYIYAQSPIIQNQSRISYADNLEGMDALTGVIGPEDDLSPIRNFGVVRQSLYMVTATGLHETQDNDQTEPSGWNVDQIADNCGAFSVASIARNAQGIGSAGKDWMMWSGPDGAQIFTGQKPWKISQEIQSIWDAIPAANAFQCWVKNYENSKRCYFGVPKSDASMQTLVLDYRNIDGAMIAENPPIHISFSGKMIVSDLTRKWTIWTLPAWCGELLYRNVIAQPQIVLGCLTPSGGANAYILNDAQFHDDDYGVIPASYTTYFFVSHEMEQALQVGSHRHIYTLAQTFVAGIGTWTLTPYACSLNNAFPSSLEYPLSEDPFFDLPFGINVNTTRCAFRIQAQPLPNSQDSYFKLQKLVINMAKDPNAPVGGGTGAIF